MKLTGVQQAQIARYALSHGYQAAIRRHCEEYCIEVRESSVSTWKSKYVAALDRWGFRGKWRSCDKYTTFEEQRPSNTFR